MTTTIGMPTVRTVDGLPPADPGVSLGFRSWGGMYNEQRHAATEAWLNRPVPWVMCTTDRKTGPGTMLATVRRNIVEIPVRKRSRLSMVMTIPLTWGTDKAHTPRGVANIASKLAATAAGAHDIHFADAATALKRSGLKDIVVRLGHEHNGAWYPWSAIENEARYVAAFRHVVDVMRAADPTIRFDYNMARARIDPTGAAAYPGDAYVDSIGIDLYWRPTSYRRQTFAEVWTGTLKPALDATVAMAAAHRKPWTISEWACEDTDTADFIRAMAGYITENEPLWHIYFGVPQARYDLAGYPAVKAAYQAAFGRP